MPPPRPPRPVPQSSTPKAVPISASAPTSRPASQISVRQFAAPPTQQLVIAKTRERTPERGPAERETKPLPAVAPAKVSLTSSVPGSVPLKPEPASQVTAYPDGSRANRRPPFVKKGCSELQTKYDPRIFDACGELVCTSGHLTRVWSLMDGEQLMSLAHTEGVRATAVAFKPGTDANTEGTLTYIGTSMSCGPWMRAAPYTFGALISMGHRI